MLKNGTAHPDKRRSYFGYSGGSDCQLNAELEDKSWLTVAATRKLIFQRNYEEIWKDTLKQ